MHFLCTQCLQPLLKILLLPTPVQQMVHVNLPELCRRSRPIPHIMIFVFPAFTLNPLLHCFFPSQEPPDTFLEWLRDDKKVICIEVLLGDLRAKLTWWGFSKHNDKEHRAEYWDLVNTDLHFKLFTLPLTNTDMAQCIGIHPLDLSPNPLLCTKLSQYPPNDLPRHSVRCLLQVYESHVESLVGSWILLISNLIFSEKKK